MEVLKSKKFGSNYVKKDDGWYLQLEGRAPRYLGNFTGDWLSEQEQEDFVGLLERHPEFMDETLPLPDERFIAKHHAPAGDAFTRATCVCFALIAAMEARFSRQGSPVGLSEQYSNWLFMQAKVPPHSWCCDGLPLIEGARVLLKHGICRRALCEYPRKMPNCEHNHEAVADAKCLEKPPQNARDEAIYKVVQLFGIPGARKDGKTTLTITDMSFLRRLIVLGYDIAVSVSIAFDWITPNDRINIAALDDNGKPEIIDDDTPGHVLLIVGYAKAPNDKIPYFICKNCWGIDDYYNSKDGYMRVSEDYLLAYARYGVFITAVSGGTVSEAELVPPS